MQIDKLFNKLQANYLISSVIIIFTIFSFFIFMTTKVKYLPLDFHTFLETSSLSILIGYQFALIYYLLSNIEPTFSKLKPLFKDKKLETLFLNHLDKKMQKSAIFYFTIILIVVPFISLEFIRFWRWNISIGPTPPYFSLFEPSNPWAFALDIINHIFGYLMLFLLANIVWIIINLIVIVHALESNTSVTTDIFHIDGIGGIRPLRNFILIAVSNYFIIITLAIISYISPEALLSYESFFLIIMLSIGVILFIKTLKTIRNMINKASELELGRINEEYKENYNTLINIISDKNHDLNKDELEKVSLVLDLLEKEKNKIKQISTNRNYLGTIATFIGSFLIPTITLIEKIRGFIT